MTPEVGEQGEIYRAAVAAGALTCRLSRSFSVEKLFAAVECRPFLVLKKRRTLLLAVGYIERLEITTLGTDAKSFLSCHTLTGDHLL